MNLTIKGRVTVFIAAIVLGAVLTGWAAIKTWNKLSELREQFTTGQIASFKTAEQFRVALLELDVLAYRYQFQNDAMDRDRFNRRYQDLNDWIDVQKENVKRVRLGAESAYNYLAKIDKAYDGYGIAATNLFKEIEQNRVAPDGGNREKLRQQFQTLEQQSQDLSTFVSALINAQEKAMIQFLDNSRSSLTYFRDLMFAAVLFLLILVAWLAKVIYQGLIAPLRVKLVESQNLIERHEKLASLGMLAAGVAHEIRNPLTAIKAWLFMHQKHLRPDTPEFADAEIISKEINRLERIVRDFLEFARPTDPERVAVPASQPLREVQTLLAPQLEKANIRLNIEDSEETVVRIDPAQIQQVLINLIQNAADAIGQNGVVTLRVRRQSKYLNGRMTEVVILEVSDTGKGIPPEVEKRLFDPFFTTKDGGTGLGLSIAARILEKHGGALQYQTQANRGTTFGIVLPA